MAATKALICNMALGNIGSTVFIQDVDTDNSVEAAHCRLYYDHIRRVILAAAPWSFATRRAALQLIGNDALAAKYPEWNHAYKMPTMSVRANHIVRPGDPGRVLTPIPFRVVDEEDGYGQVILCNEPNAVLEYNFDATDVAVFSPSFNQTFAMGLSAHIAGPLRVDPNIMRNAMQQFMDWISEAGASDLRERQEFSEAPSQFVIARG